LGLCHPGVTDLVGRKRPNPAVFNPRRGGMSFSQDWPGLLTAALCAAGEGYGHSAGNRGSRSPRRESRTIGPFCAPSNLPHLSVSSMVTAMAPATVAAVPRT